MIIVDSMRILPNNACGHAKYDLHKVGCLYNDWLKYIHRLSYKVAILDMQIRLSQTQSHNTVSNLWNRKFCTHIPMIMINSVNIVIS